MREGEERKLPCLELEPEEREEYVYQVQKNGELLIQLVNDVLDTARLDAGDYPLEMKHHLLNKKKEFD